MAKYKQILEIDNEDSFGNNIVEFIIADSLNLLTDETEALEVDFLYFDKLKISFKSIYGGLKQDEMELVSADYLVTNDDEQNCLDLIKTCTSSMVYCVVLFNPQSPLQKEDVLFLGVLHTEYEEQARKWDRTEYSESAELSMDYRFNLIPVAEASFDEILMSDVLHQVTIDSTWKNANIEDKQAWRNFSRSMSGVDYEVNTYCADLVNLNKLLRKIGDEAITMFNTTNSTSYTLNFKNRAKLTGKYAPARWRVSEINNYKLWIASDEKNNPNDTLRGSNFRKWDNTTMYHNLDDATDFREYYIDPDEIETFSEDDSLWVDAKYFIDLENDSEYSKTNADTYRIGGSELTFTDFLYSIAVNFGFLLLMEIDVANKEINITFVDADYIENIETLYFKDANKYKRDIITGILGSGNNYNSESFYGVGETKYGLRKDKNTGVIYGKDSGGVIAVKDNITFEANGTRNIKPEDNEKGSKLLFSISPTVAEMSFNGNTLIRPPSMSFIVPGHWLPLKNGDLLPHNTKVTHKRSEGASVELVNMKDAVKVDDEEVGFAFDTRSLHTALYVKAPQKQSYEPTNYFTPIRYMSVKIDGEEVGYDTLEAFLNVSRERIVNVSKADVEMNIPYWNAFSTSSDGSSPSLKNLKLGRKIVINSIEYVIRNIDINFSKLEVNLKLHINKIFTDVTNPSTPKTTDSLLGLEDLVDIDNNVFPKYYVDGTTAPFTALCNIADGKVKTITTAEEAERFIGFALETKEDEFVQVLKAPGEYEVVLEDYSFGDEIYLRVDGTTSNTDTSPASTYHSATDCVYMLLAKVIDVNRIKVFQNIPIEFAETNF